MLTKMKRLKRIQEHLRQETEFSVGFKRRIVERLRMGLSNEAEICKQHEISVNLLKDWQRWYERHFLRYNQLTRTMAYKSHSKDPEAIIAELQKKLAETEQAQQDAELTAEAWKIIIRIASEELGIDLEKKFGSGQLRD